MGELQLVHPEQPVLVPVLRPLSLIPVGLKEAALDSPTFRATAVHFSDQIDAIEKWLDGYVKAATKLTQEVLVLEGVVNAFLSNTGPPNQLSEVILDHDYTLLALKRYGEGAREFWAHTFGGIKKAERSMLDPIKTFLANDIRHFKETRRYLDYTQKQFDNQLAKYAGQAKTKEPSSLREDAFQLHEARKAYLKASMDFGVIAPQLRSDIDALLIKVGSEQWLEMKDSRGSSSVTFTANSGEIDRVRSWSQEVGRGAKNLKRELQVARKQIEESAEQTARPSRELDDYSASTVPFVGNGPSVIAAGSKQAASAKQGWLFLRTLTGKPVRTFWIRRWFFVKNGIFGCLAQGCKFGGVEESEKIGVLLCNVRAAFQEERRFCFEVKTKTSTIVLQADTQQDLTEWISAFDVAKQTALADSTTSDIIGASGNPTADPAFGVSPAVAPELAAKGWDSLITGNDDAGSGNERSAGLLAPEDSSNLASRRSFDVAASQKGEREGESSRDHAARILQKLDLHRKSNVSPQISGSNTPATTMGPSGGIASLISASHSAMPVGPGRGRSDHTVDTEPAARDPAKPSSLAPSTFVNPPVATNLSRTAVYVSSDRGLDLGVVDSTGGVPSGLMANQWGSANYGHLSRIDRGEVKAARNRSESQPLFLSNQSSPSRPTQDPFDGPNEQTIAESNEESAPNSQIGSPSRHRKTISQTSRLALAKRAGVGYTEYPNYYPQALKAQDAQLRILFPNVPAEERVVLVFRASWNPNEQQDLPGRVYVTMQEMFFYSNHFGLVLVSGERLSGISEVTGTPGKDCDYLNVYLKDRDDSSRIMMKIFLEPLRLLHRRLRYLVSNCNSREPESMQDVLQTMIDMENDDKDRSLSSESRKEPSLATPSEDPQRHGGDAVTSVRVDRNLYADEAHGPEGGAKFKLPTQPVEYVPSDVARLASERTFDISAKALFHVMFGDQSAVFQLLYRGRRAITITQYPWAKDNHEYASRHFEYQIDTVNMLNLHRQVTVIDSQTIEVANDHLCYVVTDQKTPWHLPYHRNFVLVSKIVISHISKSRCKLAIFTKVHWISKVLLLTGTIERYALDGLDLDALDLAEVVADQVQKLGSNTNTRKAIQIFGYVGHQTEIVKSTASDLSLLPQTRQSQRLIRHRSAVSITAENTGSVARSAASTVVLMAIGVLKVIFRACSAHTLLLALLIGSLASQAYWTSGAAHTWWRDRSAADFMARVGVRPNTMISRAVYLSDFDDFITPPKLPGGDNNSTSSKCLSAFRTVLTQTDLDAPADGPLGTTAHSATSASSKATALRLRRARQNLGSYRHDLLVAMRLVNRVEREAVRAEFEGWLLAEVGRCSAMEELLLQTAPNGTSCAVGDEELDGVRLWYAEYCASCRREVSRVEGATLELGL